jgi:rubrerythrin
MTNEDLISRQAVLDILDGMVKDYINENDFDKAQGVAWVKVQNLPSVSTEKTGHWIDQGYKEEWWEEYYKCSNCGAGIVGRDNYCPNCGARMVEPQESEGKI